MSRALPPLALALAAALAAPGLAEPGLYERNLAALLATLPEGAVLEVRIAGPDGAPHIEVWTAARYASFRAEHATRMGLDYAAGLQGAPGGWGDSQILGDIWSDLWGATRINVQSPVSCMPLSLPLDSKTYLYRGWCFAAEHDNACFDAGPFAICSNSYGWTFPQISAEHGDAWLAGVGQLAVFPPPFGAAVIFDGVLLAEFRQEATP